MAYNDKNGGRGVKKYPADKNFTPKSDRPYKEGKSSEQKSDRPFGDKKPYEKKTYGDKKPYEKKSFDKPYGDKPRADRSHGEYKTYWANTSSNALVASATTTVMRTATPPTPRQRAW